MTIRVPVQSLWRGVLYRRRTLQELAREQGHDAAVLRGRFRDRGADDARRAFVATALSEGHSGSEVARFLGRVPSTVSHYRRRAGA